MTAAVAAAVSLQPWGCVCDSCPRDAGVIRKVAETCTRKLSAGAVAPMFFDNFLPSFLFDRFRAPPAFGRPRNMLGASARRLAIAIILRKHEVLGCHKAMLPAIRPPGTEPGTI